jgi:hypothetical protein
MATVERTAGEYEGPWDEVEKVAVTQRKTLVVHANLEFDRLRRLYAICLEPH